MPLTWWWVELSCGGKVQVEVWCVWLGDLSWIGLGWYKLKSGAFDLVVIWVGLGWYKLKSDAFDLVSWVGLVKYKLKCDAFFLWGELSWKGYKLKCDAFDCVSWVVILVQVEEWCLWLWGESSWEVVLPAEMSSWVRVVPSLTWCWYRKERKE